MSFIAVFRDNFMMMTSDLYGIAGTVSTGQNIVPIKYSSDTPKHNYDVINIDNIANFT